MNERPTNRAPYADPPLSPIDRLLYFILIAASGSLLAILGLGHSSCRYAIAFCDPTVIASAETASYYFLAVGSVFLLLIVVFSIVYYSVRWPLLGRSDCGYFEYLPLLRSRPQDKEAPAFALWNRTISRWMFGFLILGVLTTPLSLSGRVCLHEDGSISGYNAFNQQIYRHEKEDVHYLTIGSCKIKKTKSSASTPSIYLKFYLAGHGLDPLEFKLHHFRFDAESTTDSRLEYMLTFKRCFSEESIRYDNALEADEVAEHYHFSAQEREMLNELIGLQ